LMSRPVWRIVSMQTRLSSDSDCNCVRHCPPQGSSASAGQILARGAVQDLAIPGEDRAVTGTVPRARGIVPGDDAALVRAFRRQLADAPVFVAEHRQLPAAALDDPAFTRRDLVDAANERRAVAALVELTGGRPAGIV